MTDEAIARLRAYLADADMPDETEIDSGLTLADLRTVLAAIPEPLTPQTEKYLALHTLRDAGWTVLPPVDPGAVIPEVAVGQVWRSPRPIPAQLALLLETARTVRTLAKSAKLPATGAYLDELAAAVEKEREPGGLAYRGG